MASIVLYEPDDLMHGLLCEWLGSAGHLVREAMPTNGAARRADLVVMSVSSPMRETELLIRGMQRAHPGTPIIALSSQARLGLSSNGSLARELGVKRVIAKPLARKELVAAVDEILDARDCPP
jgi:DNA-binding response OmpR family regulator